MSDPLTDFGGWKVGAADFLAAVLRTTAQPIWVVDADGIIRFANPAAIAALGYDSADELAGRPSHETIHHTHPDGTPYPAAECPMLLPRTTGDTVTSELDWFFRRDGTMFPVAYVSAPIQLPEGRGAVVAFSDIEPRRRAAEALETRDALLAEEQASLRRVAALVAQGAESTDVFAAIAREVAHVLRLPFVEMSRYEPDGTATVIGAWCERDHPFQTGTHWPLDAPTISTLVRQTGRPARVEDSAAIAGTIGEAARAMGLRSGAGAPIVVGGETWGVMAAGATDPALLPAGTEDRIAEFTELVASAISNTQAREGLRVLAEEQAALRRVATIAAAGAAPATVFRAVVDEVKEVLDLPVVALTRYEPDRMVLMMAAAGDHPFTEGTLWPLDGLPVASMVLESGEAAYLEEYVTDDPTTGPAIRKGRVRSGLAVPIMVDNEVWGTISTASTDRPLPADVVQRLTGFTELVAGVVLNVQAREELARLAEEQTALRRVATLVAEGARPGELFTAVAAEVSSVLDLPLVEMCRYEPDGTATVIGAIGDHPFQTGTNWPLDGPSLTARVKQTGRPARVDDYARVPGTIGDAARATDVRSGVGAPVVVDGEVWGVVSAGGGEHVSLRADAEERLSQFTELLATAISNTQARGDLERLAEEQAALRRLATLVAEGAEPGVVFDTVAEETGRLLGATTVNLCHFTPDGVNVTISGWSLRGVHVPAGTRLPIEGESINAIVRRTARPGRCDTYEGVRGDIAARLRSLGIRSEVGAPVMVEGVVWGVLVAGTDEPEPLPPGTERRLAEFAQLVATAIANATARTELVSSRARIVEAADEQRRRVVRDLHDGAQQRLVHALMTLQVAVAHGDVAPEVHSALDDTRAAIDELRELAHGLHPAVLIHHGLAAAVEGLADRAPFPVTVAIDDQRYAASVESAAYFVTAEALTNAAKYAGATAVTVSATREAGRLVLVVADDGVGGAAPQPGSGLAGLEDRLAALSGRLVLESRPGAGTAVRAEIPLH